jgi:hypothetical protein
MKREPLLPAPPSAVRRAAAPPLTRALATDAFGREIADPSSASAQPAASPAPTLDGSSSDGSGAPQKREAATDAIGRRAGALSDEIDFPAFVASLVHGTFDAIVDSTIRQMESFADLVAAVAKPLEQFTQENVTVNQVRDWLVQQYPADLTLTHDDDGPHVVPRPPAPAPANSEGGEEPRSPQWLADYNLGGDELTPELIEEQLIPQARERIGRDRLQTLSTMVLLGMNRVVIKDGTIGARLRFRAAAADHAKVDYAVSNNPTPDSPDAQWGQRGSLTYDAPKTMVSTVGVNVQSDSELNAELFGDVKINFASETVPLDRFVDEAHRNVLERHARRIVPSAPTPAVPQAPVTPAAPVAAAPPPPAAPAPPAPAPASGPAATGGAR